MDTSELEQAAIVGSPTWGRRLKCPECGRLLPPDAVTECDRCGAHLVLYVRVAAEGVR